MKIARSYTGLLIFVASVISMDQWTKWLVRENVPYLGAWLPAGMEWLFPYARIVYLYNTGADFGMFQGYGWVFTILAFVVSGMILFYYPRTEPQDWWLRLAMGMQMSGALGNVVDRLTLGWKVTDFISIGNFPVFNVADASITLGVVVLLVGAWRKELREKREAANANNEANESVRPSTEEVADR